LQAFKERRGHLLHEATHNRANPFDFVSDTQQTLQTNTKKTKALNTGQQKNEPQGKAIFAKLLIGTTSELSWGEKEVSVSGVSLGVKDCFS